MPLLLAAAAAGVLPSAVSGSMLFVVPGADWPGWAPWAFGAAGVATLAVLVYQAVRYFRNNRHD